MTPYERVKPATAGPVADTDLNKQTENALFILFLFSKVKKSHNAGTAVVPEKPFLFFLLLFQFQM